MFRFIPAYAGNSFGKESESVELTGSSPLTRGTLVLLPPVFLMVRFIPAYAGNSRALFFAIFFSPVHPRLRGELPVYSVPGLVDHGSSPLTRGTHCTETIQPGKGRFIPAYAGNSGHSVQGTSICPVHPRLRGELATV